MPHGFPKVGSREQIFIEKRGILGTNILKICILRADILMKNKVETVKFF